MNWEDLSARQKEALLLIGISDSEQLRNIELSHLHRDLNAAFASFPSVKEALSEQELSQLMSLDLAQPNNAEEDRSNEPSPFNLKHKGKILPLPEYDLPNLEVDDQFYILNAISKGTVLAAFTVLLAFFCTIAFFVLVYIKISAPFPPTMKDLSPAGACILGILPYFIFAFRSKCCTCGLSIFSMRSYSRSKARHHFPLLGYQIPTALHILLFRKFRCPSCGTPQRLKRK